jgi:hypothetical protein
MSQTTATLHDAPNATGLDDQQARMLEKIRKLLGQAEHKDTSHTEAEAFTAKATALMQTYRLDRAMLDLGRAEVIDLGSVLSRYVRVTAPYAREGSQLLATVATHLNCRVVITSSTKTWTKGVDAVIFGIDQDPELVEMLYTSLRIQATGGMLATKPRNPREELATFRASWLLGFIGALAGRFAQAAEDARTAEDAVRTGPADLALRSRSATVDAYVDKRFPELTTLTNHRCRGTGRREGYSAGLDADIGTGGVGPGPTGRTALDR